MYQIICGWSSKAKEDIENLKSGWIKAKLKQESLITWSKKSSANFLWRITRYLFKFFIDFKLWT